MAQQGGRPPRRRVDGVLLLDKPAGLSSNAALQRAKRLYGAQKAGHTGTLDPLATGLLPVCFGDATKFAQGLLDADKAYVADVRFGIATSTGDAEGEVVAQCAADFDREALLGVVQRFVGRIGQVPPAYAALKFEGRNYYEYARAGVDIPRAAREVRIDAIELLSWNRPVATLRVACGKGTYIRVLAEDIGAALGSRAHLTALRRTATGPFGIAGAITLEALEAASSAERDILLLPIDASVASMSALRVDAARARDLIHGRVAAAVATGAGRYRCYGPEGSFLGLVEVDSGGVRVVRLVTQVATA